MKIGIIGGGQLGMMMSEAAIKLNCTIISYDPQEECSIRKYSSKHFVGAFDDLELLKKFCMDCNIITYEFENIPFNIIKELSKEHCIYPNYKALKYSQDRYEEKMLARKCKIATTNFYQVKVGEELTLCFNKSILKTNSGGYDGKGQIILENSVSDEAKLLVSNSVCIVEEFLDFDFEISVIVNRSRDGSITTFPITKNIHKNNILYKVIVPVELAETARNEAVNGAIKLANELDLYGTLTVEYFVKDNQIIFNEMAPRPHNSGHYTIEGCSVSQFSQHIKAILGDELSSPKLLKNCIMLNILGQDLHLSKVSDGYVHMYDKTVAKFNRKMGHVTFVGNNFDELNSIVNKYLEVNYE